MKPHLTNDESSLLQTLLRSKVAEICYSYGIILSSWPSYIKENYDMYVSCLAKLEDYDCNAI